MDTLLEMLWAEPCSPKFIWCSPNPRTSQWGLIWIKAITGVMSGDEFVLEEGAPLTLHDWCLHREQESG